MMQELLPQAERIAAPLKARNETISVAESSTAGLVSAALLAVPAAPRLISWAVPSSTPALRAPNSCA